MCPNILIVVPRKSTIDMVTFHAGLYSSLLSAALARCGQDYNQARKEARLLQDILTDMVRNVNTILQIALQFENLAVRMVAASSILSTATKKAFYRNLFYTDETGKRAKYGSNGGAKLHQWFLKAVFGSDTKNGVEVNPTGTTHFLPDEESLDPFHGFAADGTVVDAAVRLDALPDDPHLRSLQKLFKNEVLGNIILAARRAWFRGYVGRWETMPPLPRSRYGLTRLFEELARDMDSSAATCVSRSFINLQSKYVAKHLEPILADNPHLKDDDLVELLCLTINRLSLVGRPALQRLKARIDLDNSPVLSVFVAQRRRSLELMVGAEIVVCNSQNDLDDDHLDFRYALGLDETKCLQLDLLVPAIIGMATELGLSATVLPEAGPTDRPLTFNQVMTTAVGRSLPDFAKAFGRDHTVAKRISDKYVAKLKLLDADDPAYDLQAISLLFDVCISLILLYLFIVIEGE